MGRLLLLGVLLLAQTAPPEPRLPAGHICVRVVRRQDKRHQHVCACRNMDDCSKPAEGQGQGPHENKGCLTYCKPDQCACTPSCE